MGIEYFRRWLVAPAGGLHALSRIPHLGEPA